MEDDKVIKQLDKLRNDREQHQKQLANHKQAIQQLLTILVAENGAIKELEALLKPEGQ